MANKVTCVLTVTPMSSALDSTDMSALIAAVPLDVGYMTGFLGCTLHTDNMTLSGFNQPVRTIVINLTPAFKALFPDASDQRAPWWNFMRGRIANRILTPVLSAAPVLT